MPAVTNEGYKQWPEEWGRGLETRERTYQIHPIVILPELLAFLSQPLACFILDWQLQALPNIPKLLLLGI